MKNKITFQAFPTYSVFSPFRFQTKFFSTPYVICASPQIRFGFTHSRGCCLEHTFQIDALNCSALPKYFYP